MIKSSFKIFGIILVLTLSCRQSYSQIVDASSQLMSARALIDRLLPANGGRFKVDFIPTQNNLDVFELEGKSNRILLKGSSGTAIASALNYYLVNYLHRQINWNDRQIKLPAILPAVTQKVRKATPYKYRYYLNYCTFNYTISWWDWERWEQEIDWMALNGINMPLAITGQNAVWDRVYKKMGLTNDDLKSFYSGPAYFNWFWMGNLDGWGGPLPQSLIKRDEELQKKILARERSLGMKPILPAFTGHVPPAFKEKFPQAKIKKTHWSTFSDVYLLDPSDPMFTQIGQSFLTEEIKTFGTDHLYTADTFNENKPPTSDSLFLNDVSKKVYQSMALADTAATWVMQGWLFHFHASFWKPQQIKAMLNAVPDDKMILLDLWSENYPVWNRTEAYYGKPWLWCMLHNFGGNISMYGRMHEVATGPSNALNSNQSGKMSGIGLTPEAIEQNPVMYALMLENIWRKDSVKLTDWLVTYAHSRYGTNSTALNQAWRILSNTVYEGGILNGGPESIITGRPTLDKTTGGTRTAKNYNPADILPAWKLFIAASTKLQHSSGFQYDLVDLTRQVLANYADTLQRQFANDFNRKDTAAFHAHTQKFMQVIDDMDKLLLTSKEFLLGAWLNSAKKMGTNSSEKALYERNARNLITLWGNKDARLHEYSCRQWAGMLSGYYKPRWKQFFNFITPMLGKQNKPDYKAFEQSIKTWEWKWVNSNNNYHEVPVGNPVQTAHNLYKKYQRELKNTYTSNL